MTSSFVFALRASSKAYSHSIRVIVLFPTLPLRSGV
jgi:hypothetical protein